MPLYLTPAQMQEIFEGGFQVIIYAYMAGLGLGMIIKLIREAIDR
jgi:hypothetical protein